MDDVKLAFLEALNKIDDYFEYRAESKKDRKFVLGVMADLNAKMAELQLQRAGK